VPTTLAPLSHRKKWLGFSAIAVSLVTMVMSLSMIFVTLSAIPSEFGVSLRVVSWVMISQALVVSALMMPAGRLADPTGRHRTHLIGLVIFGAGSILSALAPSLMLLIVGRAVSAVGLATGQAVGTAMLASLFPESERATAIGSQMTAVAIGGAGGPVLAGLVLELASWRVLFGLLAIPILIAFAAGYFVLDEERVSQGARDADGR
jgi:MFS family permease